MIVAFEKLKIAMKKQSSLGVCVYVFQKAYEK